MTSPRLYPPHPLIGASAAVFRDGRVLVAARARPPLEALWSLPGGLVDLGETLEEAALRELREEVGVRAEILGFAGHAEVIERDGRGVRRHFVVAAFAASWRDGEASALAEISAVEWVDPARLGERPTTPGLAEIVERAAALVRQSEAVRRGTEA